MGGFIVDSYTLHPAVSDIIFSDDFTGSDLWSEVGVPDISVDTTANELVAKMDRTSTNNKCVYDLGRTINDTTWLLRIYQLNFSVIGATNAIGYIGLSSADQNTGHNSAQDHIGLILDDNGNANNWGGCDADGTSLPVSGDDVSTTSLSTATDYWVEIIRSSATAYSVEIFSNSGFSTSVLSITGAVASTVVGLRYIAFNNYVGATADTPIEFKVQKVDFWEGLTSPP